MRYFSGVGSRETPFDVLEIMTKLASELEDLGFILRSGAAPGADRAFEAGIKNEANKHIYLPWRGFMQHPSNRFISSDAAFAMAMKVHPRWGACTPAAKKFHARNIHQVLGDRLQQPSDLLVCWTQNGQDVGGTRTAIVVAKMHQIPVFNLFSKSADDVLECAKALVADSVG